MCPFFRGKCFGEVVRLKIFFEKIAEKRPSHTTGFLRKLRKKDPGAVFLCYGNPFLKGYSLNKKIQCYCRGSRAVKPSAS